MFLQSIMLSAVEHGLATCPQAALAEYPEIVKKALGYEDQVLICGMALGYEDPTEDVNSYRTGREDLDKLVRYFS
jgi:nitroreductase